MAFNSDSSLISDDGFVTATSIEQEKVENIVLLERNKKNFNSRLLRDLHIKYLLKNLEHLPKSYAGLDSSRSWICFWGVHSLNLLGHRMEKDLINRIITFLEACRTPEGGYSGAPGQLAHLATTYASVMALVSLGTERALCSIDKNGLRQFIISMRKPNGSFTIHRDGETDVRAAYCALAVAHICNLPDMDEVFEDTPMFLIRCQTYEGGFGGEPNCEAHGGYTFCALAALALLQKIHLVNLDGALRWLVYRQMRCEGGFQGRTNKLVDGCYSYWQAACFSILEFHLNQSYKESFKRHFDINSLQSYILDVCQDEDGGLKDKPEKHPDMYHTCYTLSGLSVAQTYALNQHEILGGESNILEPLHPVYNITKDKYERAQQYFTLEN